MTLWTGLLAAVEVREADVVVVADGPGNLGTDTTWGVSALGSGEALNAVEALGGRPVAALRISFADRRERHRGVSHHSLTILERVCTVRANVVVPALDGAERDLVWDALRGRRLEERHQLVEADGEAALASSHAQGSRSTPWDAPRPTTPSSSARRAPRGSSPAASPREPVPIVRPTVTPRGCSDGAIQRRGASTYATRETTSARCRSLASVLPSHAAMHNITPVPRIATWRSSPTR